MNETALWIDKDRQEPCASPSRNLSFLRFLLRYPIFLLAFGPPLFRVSAIDATRGIIDIWSVIQVGLLVSIALRATLRLAFEQEIFLPKQIRSVLKLSVILGILFLASAIYSPNRLVSLAYFIAYLLATICVIEFAVDACKAPPNWMQCIFHLRFIAFLVFALDVFVLFFNSKLVVTFEEGAGMRFGGGSVGLVTHFCPIIAVISAYAFLHSLEPKLRSVFFFLIGLAGTLSTQSRGCELALLLTLSVLVLSWAKSGKRSTFLFFAGFLALILLSGAALGAIGAGRIWRTFNRGESAEGIASASGRTAMWHFVIRYCLSHPQGMGYVAGFRMIFREQSGRELNLTPASIGNAHNSHIQVLADAGWLALVVYLAMVVKIVRLGMRFARKRSNPRFVPDAPFRMPLECSMFLLISFLLQGMDTALYTVPLTASFYWQNIIIAIILAISGRLTVMSRTQDEIFC